MSPPPYSSGGEIESEDLSSRGFHALKQKMEASYENMIEGLSPLLEEANPCDQVNTIKGNLFLVKFVLWDLLFWKQCQTLLRPAIIPPKTTWKQSQSQLQENGALVPSAQTSR